MDPPNNITDPNAELVVPQTLSESLEISYQIMFFLIGTPLNISAIRRTARNLREGGVESRLVKLSRQLMIAHIMVLVVYGLWRSWWIYSFFWTQGEFMCRLFSFFQVLPFHLWSNIVAAIAIDMLCCIGSPLNSYRNGATRVRYSIICSWLVAIVCAAPMALVRHTHKFTQPQLEFLINGSLPEDYNREYFQCSPDMENLPEWVVLWNSYLHVFTSFYGPLVIIIACYSSIGFILHKQMTTRRLISDGNHVTAARTSATKARFLKATVAIVLTYVLTWLPYQVIHLLTLICDETSTCASFTANINFLQAIIIARQAIHTLSLVFLVDACTSRFLIPEREEKETLIVGMSPMQKHAHPTGTCINPFLYSFGVDRKNRNSGTISTFENAPRATVIVSMPAHRRYPNTETLTFIPPQRTRSVSGGDV